jgi:hypothetical protein
VQQDDRYRLFLERSTAARALFPGEFDLGMRLSGGWHFIRYAIAVMNGQPIEGSSFPGLDPNGQKDVLGRVGIEEKLEGTEIAAGFSALRGKGFHAGALATKPTLQWNDANGNNSVDVDGHEIVGTLGTPATPSASFTRFAVGADLSVSRRFSALLRTSVAGELYVSQDLDRGVLPADPKGVLRRSFRELGYYLALIQEIGRWQLGVRYDFYDPDQDANKILYAAPASTNASYSTIAVVAACTASWGRALLEYDRNRNHLGIDLAGMPANLADNTVVLRGEVRF